MQDFVHVILGEGIRKPVEVSGRSFSVFPWPNLFSGYIRDLSQGEALAFLRQDGEVDAEYKAHRYKLKLLDLEGRFVAARAW